MYESILKAQVFIEAEPSSFIYLLFFTTVLGSGDDVHFFLSKKNDALG